MTTHLAITFSNKSAMKISEMSLGEFAQVKKRFRKIKVLIFLDF